MDERRSAESIISGLYKSNSHEGRVAAVTVQGCPSSRLACKTRDKEGGMKSISMKTITCNVLPAAVFATLFAVNAQAALAHLHAPTPLVAEGAFHDATETEMAQIDTTFERTYYRSGKGRLLDKRHYNEGLLHALGLDFEVNNYLMRCCRELRVTLDKKEFFVPRQTAAGASTPAFNSLRFIF